MSSTKLIDLEQKKLERKMQLQLAELFDGFWAFTIEPQNTRKKQDTPE